MCTKKALLIKYKIYFFRELIYNREDVSFHNKLNKIAVRTVVLTNKFPFGLAIWNVSLVKEAKNIFEV